MKRVSVKFRGLDEGRYNYQFKINNDFFDDFKESEIHKASVDAEIEMIISKDLLILNISLKGMIEVQCDRCLGNYFHSIEYKTELFVEFGEKNSDISDADNKIVLSNKEDEIVLDKHLYDYLHLSVPYQKIHPNDETGNSSCDPDMIKKLDDLNTKNNTEFDPRWDKLKDLYN